MKFSEKAFQILTRALIRFEVLTKNNTTISEEKKKETQEEIKETWEELNSIGIY